MKTTHSCVIEFIGGPFDGHVQSVSLPPRELIDVVALPVNSNVLHMVNGEPVGEKSPASSIAVYERDSATAPPRYRYVGATRAEQFCLQNWVG
jgi:hypothetical protein